MVTTLNSRRRSLNLQGELAVPMATLRGWARSRDESGEASAVLTCIERALHQSNAIYGWAHFMSWSRGDGLEVEGFWKGKGKH